jgi:hypothetical protein
MITPMLPRRPAFYLAQMCETRTKVREAKSGGLDIKRPGGELTLPYRD